MDAFDLDPNLLNGIFKQNEISQATIKELLEWHHSLDPSFGLLRSILAQYFQLEQYQTLIHATKRVDQLLLRLQVLKCPKNFVRAFLSNVKDQWQQIKNYVDVQTIVKLWIKINPEILQYFFEAFNIAVDTQENKENEATLKLSIDEYEKKIKTLIDSKDYNNAIILIKLIGYPEKQVKLLLEKMANNKDASKAANFIKSHKLDPKLVPQVGERLNKNMIRYFLKSHGWQVAEEIFEDQPEAIACLIQDLAFKNMGKEAISLWWRHPGALKFISKEDCQEWLQKQISKDHEQIKQEVIENPFFKDFFGPSDLANHLSLRDFGIQRQHVIWVEDNSISMNQLVQEIRQAEQLAIDTESIVGKTKLERKKLQPASIIQIAFQKRIYILDGLKCKNADLQAALLEYIGSGRPVLGHAINNDLDAMLFSIGITEQEINAAKCQNIIDTCSLFKAIYPKEKYSNLAHICKQLLKKEICKQQTLTNWARRPLRENQMHYAAMDAFCVLKIFEALRDEVGENMINYFLQQAF